MWILTAIFVAVVSQDPPREPAPLSRLTSMQISVDFTEATLREAIDYFREATDLNFHIDAKVVGAGEIRITARLKQVRVISALRLILAQHDLAAVFRDGIVVVTPRSEVERKVVTFAYDIRDLAFSIRDFPGPRIEFQPRSSGETETGPEVKFVLLEGPATPPSREEGILELIRASTGGTTWDDNPHAKIQLAPNGLLLVTQSIRVHQEIERLLKSLRNR